jgi:membrane-associated phospholipid phosphatase
MIAEWPERSISRLREAAYEQRWMIAAIAASYIGYFLPSRLPIEKVSEVPELAIDRAMPLIPWTVLGYWFLYPFLIGTVLYLSLRPKALRAIGSALIASNLIGGVIFTAWRTTVPRPMLIPDTAGERLLALLWRLDPPYNVFPSLHAAYGFIILFGFIRMRSRRTPLVLLCSFIVIFTTLTTYQHRVLDLMGGFGLAAVLCMWFYRNLGPEDEVAEARH